MRAKTTVLNRDEVYYLFCGLAEDDGVCCVGGLIGADLPGNQSLNKSVPSLTSDIKAANNANTPIISNIHAHKGCVQGSLGREISAVFKPNSFNQFSTVSGRLSGCSSIAWRIFAYSNSPVDVIQLLSTNVL